MTGKLEAALKELEGHLPRWQRLSRDVSGGSVGWHIEHTLLTLDAVLEGLVRSSPQDYRGRFDIRRAYVMTTGKIPRGKVQAPKLVRPAPGTDEAGLRRHLQETRSRLEGIRELPAGHYFTHPFLGDFRLKAALRFLEIHTKHHLHIIRDICK